MHRPGMTKEEGCMADQVELRCRCGEVRGLVTAASPRAVNRVVCYCDDCQAFAHQLGRADLLDPQGGSDIVQLAPASLTFLQGRHRIVGLRLGPKGLFRWYASCCNTPVGNTLTPAIPFVGVVAQAFDQADGLWPTDRRDPRQVCDRRAAGRLDRPQPAAAVARHRQGTRLAPARKSVAASVLRARQRRAGLSGDRTVAGTARRVASVVRTACRGFDFVGRISEA